MKRTTKDFIRFARFGIGYMYTDVERGMSEHLIKAHTPHVHIYITIDFAAATEYFKSNDIDLAVCDHYADPCYSAASLLNIPYVITSAFPITEGVYYSMSSAWQGLISHRVLMLYVHNRFCCSLCQPPTDKND